MQCSVRRSLARPACSLGDRAVLRRGVLASCAVCHTFLDVTV
jgi:hypothetical protein